MAKCYLCGKESNVEITIKGYNHKEYICGVCALDNDIIKDKSIAELIRKAEGLSESKACIICKKLLTINARKGNYLCQRFDVPLKEQDVQKNYCECFERLRQ